MYTIQLDMHYCVKLFHITVTLLTYKLLFQLSQVAAFPAKVDKIIIFGY